MDSAHLPTARPSVSTAPRVLGLSVVRTAGGDPHLAAALRYAAWSVYLDAGCPLGETEEGFEAWWAEQLTADA